MRIQHNISALNTHRNLAFNNAQASKNLEKLSSGYKINRAGDDAAGLAISEKMRGQIRGLDMASKNSQDGISLIQTAEGALNETHAILQRMRELAVQAGNDTNTTDDRGQIQKEIDQLTSEINRIGNTTEFNTKKLVNGELGAATTSKEVAVGGDYKVGASAVSGDNVAAIKGDKVELKITGKASGDLDWSALDATKTNTLTITKETDGSVKVNVAAEAGAKTLTIADKAMEFDGTNYTFNQDGISFKFSKDQVDKMEADKDIKVDLNQGATTGTNDITSNPIDLGAEVSALTASAPTTTKVSDVAVDANGLPEGTKSIEIEKKADNEFTITFKDKDGTALNTSDYKAGATDKSFEFNQNGIAFKADFDAAGDTFKTEIALKTEKQTVTDTTAKDTSIKFQIGANENQAMAVSISDMRASALGITGSGDGFQKSATVTNGTDAASVEKSLDLSTHASAASAITVIDNAISTVSTQRSQLGAVQNRLEHTINNLGASSENLTAAESRIRDTDMAKEMMGFTKNNILMQAAQSMLAQANQQPQGVLQLLG